MRDKGLLVVFAVSMAGVGAGAMLLRSLPPEHGIEARVEAEGEKVSFLPGPRHAAEGSSDSRGNERSGKIVDSGASSSEIQEAGELYPYYERFPNDPQALRYLPSIPRTVCGEAPNDCRYADLADCKRDFPKTKQWKCDAIMLSCRPPIYCTTIQGQRAVLVWREGGVTMPGQEWAWAPANR